MDHRSSSARLLARLRKETNGAVVADMEDRGLHYGRNYGVSQHMIRNAAKEFAPDHDLAKYLWLQPIRELKIAATTIADPQKVTADELKFWFEGATNNELSENLASFLLSRTALTDSILDLYGDSSNEMEQYAAILSAARGNPENIHAEKIITCVESAAGKGSPQLLRAAGLLLSKTAGKPQVQEYINHIKGQESRRALFDEIM